ncbi:hypothetical protein [Nocardioides sp.]|uniref:hypothetical protein n=1 Tax=Nocardioides sp. TaxID=35761 RepID=UPI002B279AFD|nr:hypothetical protein [Nocardioides sp.]
MATLTRTARLCALATAASVVLALPATSAGTSEVSTSSDSPRGSSTRFDVSDLPTGAPPGLAWLERTDGGAVVHGATGTLTPVPKNTRELAPMGSGYVIQTASRRPPRTRWVGADGSPGRRTWKTGFGIGVSARGEAVAFSGKRGRVWSIDQEGDRVLRFNPVPIKGKGQAVAVAGEDCSEQTSVSGCSIYVNGPRGYYTSSHGIVDRVPRMRIVSTGRGRFLGGITSVSDTGTCNVMLSRWRPRWRTCDNRFSDISTDNKHVLGLPAYGDGFGPTRLDLLKTRDGEVVHSYIPSRRGDSATYFDEVWEDAEHVLVVTFQADEWAVVRLDLDGSMEYAVPPRASDRNMTMPFELQTR